MFLNIGVLRNLQYSQKNARTGPCRPSFTEHLWWLLLDFRSNKYFFSVESIIYCWKSQRLLLWTHELRTLKIRVKPQRQPLEHCEIVYKKTSERQRVIKSGTTIDNEWQRVVQRVATSSTSENEWKRVATSGTTNDNEWHIEWKRMKANESGFRFQNQTIMQYITTTYSATSFWKYM